MNESLKICLLSYRSNPHCGGQGVYVKHLSKALTALGHQVEVVTGPPGPALDNGIPVHKLSGLDLYNPDDLFRTPSLKELSNPVNLIEWLGVSTMGFPEPFTFGIRAFRFLQDKFNAFDLVHDNQSLSYGIQKISSHIPTIATIHHPMTVDRDLAVKSAPSWWKKLKQKRWYSFIGMQKRVSRKLSRIITVSEASSRDLSKAYHIPLHRFRIVPNGIDTRMFYPIENIERKKYRVVVTNSADTPLKGLRYLLLAVERISKKRPVELVVIGSPRKNGDIRKLIGKLGIGRHVTFTGRIPHEELVMHYARAAVAVIPSLYEGFGLPAGEAMACGIPVISTTGGALPEVLGNAGLLVPPADASALTDAIHRVFDNPQLAYDLGQSGYRRVQAHFTWKRAAEKTVDAYREAIRDHRRF
ncbi:glycosyltransferase family 4 protein [Thermodesulfobacteriota bacterium]